MPMDRQRFGRSHMRQWKGSAMTLSKSRVRFEQLGPVRAVVPGRSGLPADVMIRPAANVERRNTVFAIKRLVVAGLGLAEAKTAIEEALRRSVHDITLPAVEDVSELAADMQGFGFDVERAPLVRAIRRKLKLSQAEFAGRYGIPVSCVRDWELGRTKPDKGTVSYLHVIAKEPERAAAAIAGAKLPQAAE